MQQMADASAAPTLHARDYAIRGEYQRQNTTQTLREGLAEYYAVNPGLLDPDTMEDEFSANYFRCHDTTHVVFGTHTGPLDEGVNDLFTMFGVEVTYRRYVKEFFQTSGASDIANDYRTSYSVGSMFELVWHTLRLLPKVRRSCKAMTRKWPWDPPEGALDRPLAEIRAEYGIEVWRPEVVLDLPRDR